MGMRAKRLPSQKVTLPRQLQQRMRVRLFPHLQRGRVRLCQKKRGVESAADLGQLCQRTREVGRVVQLQHQLAPLQMEHNKLQRYTRQEGLLQLLLLRSRG